MIMTGQKSADDPRWNLDPRTSIGMYPVGTYAPLPQAEITSFTTEPRYVPTPIGTFGIYPNYRVHPSSGTQSEVPIVRHPTNQQIMLASANTFRGGSTFSTGVYVTTNGGTSWFGSDTLNNGSFNYGDPGPMIDKDGRFLMSYITLSFSMGASYSTNNGINWAPTVTFPGASTSADKNLSATDDSPVSPYYGRSYTVYTEFAGSYTNRIVMSYTTNGGVTWSSIAPVSPPTSSGHHHQGCDVRVGPTGEVYVVWANCTTSGQNSTEDSLGFAKSTNGGVNWVVSKNNASNMNGIRSSNLFNGIRANGFPRIDVDRSGGPRNGWIYAVASEKTVAPATDGADVILHRSTDEGTTWTRVRVNQDPAANGKYQYFPAVRVDEAGGINVVYYDTRNTPTNDSAQAYMSRSLDGGVTWTDVQVSDHKFRPAAISGTASGYQGDYIGITSGNGKAFPYWADNSTGIYQAWIAEVQITTYPLNPFNLTSPSAGSRIVTVPNSTTVYTFDWDTAASTASYKWVFGSPTTSPRKLTLVPTGDVLTITGGQLDNLLAGIGLAQGDSLVGQWDVWSFRNNSENDSLKATNGPRAITLRRGLPSLSPFTLNSPASGITVNTSPVNSATETFTWNKSGAGVSYKWKFGSPALSNVRMTYPANGGGFDSVFSVVNSVLDGYLASIGVAPGDSITGVWGVYGYTTSDSLKSSNPDRTITFRRAGLLALDQGFTETAFPPLFWGLENGGGSTQYWTRNNVGGYQVGTGSAKYDYWSAQTSTPLQTLTSNQFPAVTSPVNYLRFNYSHAYYNATSVAPDSMIVETSTNNGSSWSVLIRMGASQTLSSGYNSSPILTTVGGPVSGAFTPSLASHWATKILLLPVGTNKVRFVAKSGYGNNVYIDNITSGPMTGAQNQLTFIPDRFELQQNYPNPFNPVTKINFSLPAQTQVTMKVYDVLGKEVATLINEVKPAGMHDVSFNASNLSSGIYFYKIEAGEFTDIKRMMLIK